MHTRSLAARSVAPPSLASPRSLSILALGLLVAVSQLPAAPPERSSATEQQQQRISELIPQLGASDFSTRQAASHALFQMGKQAIGALAEVAESETGESQMRAMELLRRHFEQGETRTRQAAQAALEQLAEGNHPAGRRAAEILEPEATAPSAIRPNAVQLVPQMRVQLQMNMQARQGNNVQRTRVTQRGNTRTVEVERNDLEVKIIKDPQGIQLEVTKKKGDKQETKKYKAQDEDELKKKHPEAHRVYKQYWPQGLQLKAANRALQQAVPAAPRAKPFDADDAEVQPAAKPEDKQPEDKPTGSQKAPAKPAPPQARKLKPVPNARGPFERIEASIERQKEQLRRQLDDQPAQLEKHLKALDNHLERIRELKGRQRE